MGTRTRPVAYLVTIWPEGHECSDATMFSLLVRYHGNGQWAVEGGWTSGDRKMVLGVDGDWHLDNPGLRFPLEDALRLAEAHAPRIAVCGITAAQALAWHQEHSCPDW